MAEHRRKTECEHLKKRELLLGVVGDLGVVLPLFDASLDQLCLCSAAKARSIAERVVDSVGAQLAALHQCNLVHLDVCPGNIVWRASDMAATLIDFESVTEFGKPVSTSPVQLSFYAPAAIESTTSAVNSTDAASKTPPEDEPATAGHDWRSLGLVVLFLVDESYRSLHDQDGAKMTALQRIQTALAAGAPMEALKSLLPKAG